MACGGGGSGNDAWCDQLETATRSFAEVYEQVPEGADAEEAIQADPKLRADAEEAGREMQRLRELKPPQEIAAEFRLVTTTLPPSLTGGSTEERERYDEAADAVREYAESECEIDPELVDVLAEPPAAAS